MTSDSIGIGMIGYAFMGRAHSHAWRNVGRFFDIPLTPRMAGICGRDAAAVGAAAERLGWETTETDWRRLVERADIDVIDVCTPGSSHAEIAVAALEAGKHVLCEKPLANNAGEAEQMAAAAARAQARGAVAMVGFNYRRVPAVALIRSLVSEGRLGAIRHVRARYLQDWPLDPGFPLLWRFLREEAGTGAIGDMASHIVDLTQHLCGQSVSEVSALTRTFIEERPLPSGRGRGEVTVDDAAAFLARLDGGAIGSYEVSRLAPGHRNGLWLELNGEHGSVAWDLERLNEIELFEVGAGAPAEGFRRTLVTDAGHPYVDAWWPPGHILGWEHTFVHEVRDFLHAVAGAEPAAPDFGDGLQVQRVLDAVVRSAGSGSWERAVDGTGPAAETRKERRLL
jgi:predicted dehydrogenase